VANGTFTLSGKYSLRPPVGPTGVNDTTIAVDLSETITILSGKASIPVTLAADGAEAVAFGDIASANIVIIHCDAKVIARFTSADGTTQAVPVDDLLLLITEAVPITALTLQRVAGILTNAQVVLGVKAP